MFERCVKIFRLGDQYNAIYKIILLPRPLTNSAKNRKRHKEVKRAWKGIAMWNEKFWKSILCESVVAPVFCSLIIVCVLVALFLFVSHSSRLFVLQCICNSTKLKICIR